MTETPDASAITPPIPNGLLKILYDLRHKFGGRLTKRGYEGIVNECGDPREHQKPTRDTHFGSEPLSGGVRTFDKNDAHCQEVLGRLKGYFKNDDTTGCFIINTHTECAAVKKFYEALVAGPRSEAAYDPFAMSMKNMFTIRERGELGNILKAAKKAGADEETILRKMEMLIMMQSVKNLHDYKIIKRDGTVELSVENLINEGRLHIITNYDDVRKGMPEQHKLLTYIPSTQQFCNLDVLYHMAFPDDEKPSAKRIEKAYAAAGLTGKDTFISLPVGTNGHKLSKVDFEQSKIEIGIREIVADIRNMGQKRGR